jgi:DASS family divalent anion:Na+ symporter
MSDANQRITASSYFKLAICVAVGAAIWFSPRPADLSAEAWHCFAVFAATILSFIVRPFPMGPMVLLGLLVLAATNTFEPAYSELFKKPESNPGKASLKYALHGYGDSTTWLVVAAFLISGAVIRTGLGRRIALTMISRFGRTTLGLGYSAAGAELLLGPFVPSNTARGGGVMAPIMNSLARALESSPNVDPRRAGEYLMLCGAHLNLVTAAMFLTGMAGNPLVAQAAKTNLNEDFGWGTWLAGSIVPGISSLLLLPLFLYLIAPPQLKDASEAQKKARNDLAALGPWSRQQIILTVVFVVMLALWTTSLWHGLDTTLIAIVGVATLVFTGVERWKDVMGNSAAWDAMMWLGGLITMSNALSHLGFADWFAQTVKAELPENLGAVSVAVILALIYFYSMYGFSMMSGHIMALVGVFLAIAVGAGTSPLLIVALLAYFSNLCGCTTNYSTGPVIIYFGLGYVPAARWFKIGFLVSLFHLTIWLGVGLPYWKWLGWW